MHADTHIHHQRTISARRLCWLAAALLTPTLEAQFGLGLTPMRLEFPAAGGKAYSGTLSLSNSSESRIRVRTEILDLYIDDNQTPQFLAEVPGEAQHSCRTWITVNPMEAEVAPRSQMPIRYTLRVPAEAGEQSYHCAIGFVSLPSLEEQKGVEVRTAVRVVAALYPIVGKPEVKGQIADLSLEPVPAGDKIQWRSVMVMENAGHMLYRPQGKIQVVDAGGKVIETLDVVSFPVLPQRRQRFLLPLKNPLATGRYTLRARVDLGTEIQEASAEVTAEPVKR